MSIRKFLVPNPRPYWHVDAKWFCGILLIFTLIVTLALFVLIKLTDERRGPTVAALTVGSLFIRGDSLGDIEEAREELKKHGGVIHPLPNMPEITITEQDLHSSSSEIKLKVFKPLTTMLYQDGIEATAAKYAKTEGEKRKFIKDASALRVFTKQFHESLKSRLSAFVIIAIILFMSVVYFSAGWGRLANPGLQLLLLGLPGSLLGLMITHPPKDGDGGGVGFVPKDIAAELGAPIGEVYYRVTIFGAVLLLLALIGKVVGTIVKKHHAKSSTEDRAETHSDARATKQK